MPNDPSIPLSVRPFQAPDPIASIGQLMQVRNLAGEYALHQQQLLQSQQQTADIQAQAQQRNRDLADQNTVQEAMKDPKSAAAFHTGDFSDLEGKVQPKTLATLQTNQATLQKDLLSNTQTTNALRATGYSDIGDTTQGLLSLVGKNADGTPDLTKVNAEMPNAIARLQASGAFRNAGIDAPPAQAITDPSQLETFLGGARGAAALHSKVADLQKTQAATAASSASAASSEASAANLRAELPGKTAQSSILTAEAAAMNMTPAQASEKVGAIVDPAKYPTVFKTALAEYQGALKYEDKQKVLDKFGTMMAELDPDVMKTKRANTVQTAVDTELRKSQLAPGGLASIVDPSIRAKAETQMNTDLKSFQDTMNDAERFQKTVDLALAGNQNAPGMLGPEEMRQVVNRVNAVELNAVGKGAGSAWQRVQGFLGGLKEGEPIPPQILQDMKQVSRSFQTVATNRFRKAVSVNNALNGGKLNADDFVKIVAPAPAGAFSVQATLGGKTETHNFDSETEAANFENLVKQNQGTTSRVK